MFSLLDTMSKNTQQKKYKYFNLTLPKYIISKNVW